MTIVVAPLPRTPSLFMDAQPEETPVAEAMSAVIRNIASEIARGMATTRFWSTLQDDIELEEIDVDVDYSFVSPGDQQLVSVATNQFGPAGQVWIQLEDL